MQHLSFGLRILSHSAPSWILSSTENVASFSLEDGATEWHDYVCILCDCRREYNFLWVSVQCCLAGVWFSILCGVPINKITVVSPLQVQYQEYQTQASIKEANQPLKWPEKAEIKMCTHAKYKYLLSNCSCLQFPARLIYNNWSALGKLEIQMVDISFSA